MNLVDLAAQHKSIQVEAEEAVLKTLRSGKYILGEQVESFESELADYLGVRFCVTVSSGTAALLCAALALDITGSVEYVTTPFSFIGTIQACLWMGWKLRFVDIDPLTYNMQARGQRFESAVVFPFIYTASAVIWRM